MFLTPDKLDIPRSSKEQETLLTCTLEQVSAQLAQLTHISEVPPPIEDEPDEAASQPRLVPLMRTKVAGTSHLPNYAAVIKTLEPASPLLLSREPQNAYDPKAILLHTTDGLKVGYIPADSNELLSKLLDGGIRLCAKVLSIYDHGFWADIPIRVYLER